MKMIDSHAHMTYYSMANQSPKQHIENEYPYLALDNDGKCIRARGTRSEIIKQMKASGVDAVIEPAISFYSNVVIQNYAKEHPGFLYTAVGRHPKDCFKKTGIKSDGTQFPVKWKDRYMLDFWTAGESVVAVGETGLDYHYAKKFSQKRLQRKWFIHQIMVAYYGRLPLILHIREADKAAIKILKRCKSKLRGGVVHCFCGDAATAKEYLELGLYLGIGCSLMRENVAAAGLREAVREAPLDRLIVETDTPFQLPDLERFAEGEKKKNLRNTPLLLPLVIQEIAEIKGITEKEVEQAVYQNTVKLFRLNQDT